jgi:hypothetical protein
VEEMVTEAPSTTDSPSGLEKAIDWDFTAERDVGVGVVRESVFQSDLRDSIYSQLDLLRTKLVTPEELEAMTRLFRDAVGYDEKRGDIVSVSSMAFYQAPPEEPAEEPGILQSPSVKSLGKQGLAAALILVVALVLVKPLLRALGGGVPGLPGQGLPALAGGGSGSGGSGAFAAHGRDGEPDLLASLDRHGARGRRRDAGLGGDEARDGATDAARRPPPGGGSGAGERHTEGDGQGAR